MLIWANHFLGGIQMSEDNVTRKEIYEKPEIEKKGELKDITAGNSAA